MIEDRYARATAIMESMGNDPTSMATWRRVDPVVGPELDRMLGEFCWGGVWAGDGLDLRTRRIITLATIATQGRDGALSGHVKMALEQGFTRREVMEVFLHLVPYVGFPTALGAIAVADEVFTKLDEEAGEGITR